MPIDEWSETKGVPGDNIPTSELKPQISKSWQNIEYRFLDIGSIKRNPFVISISRSKQKIGLPTVMNRMIQQAINHYFQHMYDMSFSNSSYGSRFTHV